MPNIEPDNSQLGRMAVARPARSCPICNDAYLKRVKREAWTARVPFSKLYTCSKCKSSFLRIFDFFQLKVRIAGNSSRNRNKEYIIIAFGIAVTVYVCCRIVLHLYEDVP